MRAVRDAGLPRTVLTVAWALALRADQQGCCWPSYQQLADDIGLDRSHTIRHVKHLREAGWLSVANRVNGHGHRSNSYQLTLPNLWKTGQGSGPGATTLVALPPPPSGPSATPQGVAPAPPRREGVKEERRTSTTAPVDNRHLTALLHTMARQHRIP
jgi:biotin operon repressor